MARTRPIAPSHTALAMLQELERYGFTGSIRCARAPGAIRLSACRAGRGPAVLAYITNFEANASGAATTLQVLHELRRSRRTNRRWPCHALLLATFVDAHGSQNAQWIESFFRRRPATLRPGRWGELDHAARKGTPLRWSHAIESVEDERWFSRHLLGGLWWLASRPSGKRP